MLRIGKILVPVEFHETSLRILAVAGSIARRFHSEIVLLHVVAPESYSQREWKQNRPIGREDLLPELFEYAERDLHESVRPELEGLPLKCVVRNGDASTEIIEALRQEAVDLIVMATHGRKGFYSHLIGSVTAKVMYASDRPVLAAAHFSGLPNPDGTRHVLCGVTFAEHSQSTLKCAAKIAAEFQAKLTIAHVTPSVDLYGPGGAVVDRRWQDELVHSAEELIARVQQETGVRGESAVESGDPGTGLSKIADCVGADLLVVGCHYSGGHMGTNSYGIIAESKIPVLSV